MKTITEARLRSVTRFLFVTTQIAALCWVSVSYLIALYAAVWLGEVEPLTTLSGKAIDAILGVSALKVLGNLFEHNEGGLFGRTKKNETPDC